MKFLTGTLRGRLYLLLIVLALVTVSVTAYMRYDVESSNDQIDIVLNYEQMNELSLQSEEGVEWWLTELGKVGATAVAIKEDLLIEYLKDNFIPYYLTGDIHNNPVIADGFPQEVMEELESRDNYDLIIHAETPENLKKLTEGLVRYEALDITIIDRVIIVNGEEEDLLYETSGNLTNADGQERFYYDDIVGTKVLQLPIGFDEDKIDIAYAADLNVLLRPANHSDFADDMVANYMDEIEKYDRVMPLLLSHGKEELGYNSATTAYVKDIAGLVEKYDFTVALTESNVQRQYGDKGGLNQIVAGFKSPEFVRVFSMWPYIQERYIYPGYSHGEEIGNAMFRAITERNIRVVLFNPFMWNEFDYVTNIDDYRNVFADLENRLATHGYSYGDFTVLDDLVLPGTLRVLLYMEILLFGVVLLNEGIIRVNKYVNGVLVVAAILGAVGLHYVVPNLSVKLFAFLASIIFASLAGVVYYNDYLGNEQVKGTFVSGIGALIVSGLTALLGGIYIGSVMAYTKYFLEIELFTGVKLSLLGPIAVIILFMAIQYIKEKASTAEQNIFIKAKDESIVLLRQPIQVQHIVLMVFAMAFGYLYLARSGHESGVDPMSFEIVMRNFLENILPARPRNKEFLIAFPAIILGLSYKRYFDQWSTEIRYMVKLIIMGMAVIGFTSVTNTFSHIRTPLMMSVVRTLISIGFGVLVALVLYIGINILIWMGKKVVRSI